MDTIITMQSEDCKSYLWIATGQVSCLWPFLVAPDLFWLLVVPRCLLGLGLSAVFKYLVFASFHWCFPSWTARLVSELFQKAFAHTHLPSNSGFCWHLWYTLAILTDTFGFNPKPWSTYSTVKCRKLDNLCVFLWPVHIFPWGKLICLQINQYYLLLCPFTWI